MLIGLTGGIGSGKSTVLAIFRDLGCPVFSADAEVARLLKEPAVLDALREAFGLAVFDAGALDKNALASVVFGGPGPLKRLEAILHPRVLEGMAAFAAAHPDEVAVAEVPLLFEKRLESLFACTVCVHCPEETGFKRYAAARGVSLEEARRRASWQLPLDSKVQWADHCLDGEATLESLRRQVETLLERLKAQR